jgi:mannose-1-phosphate guanylyltransferase
MILAAGQNARLRPLTWDQPIPMLQVGGKPILEHLIELLRHHGINEIAINPHDEPDVITQHFGDGERHGVKITYFGERQPLSSAGAAKQLKGFFTDTFLVVSGNILTDLNVSSLMECHHAKQAAATIALHGEISDYGTVVASLADDGRIVQLVERSTPSRICGDLASMGIYALEPTVLELVPPAQSFDFSFDLLPKLLEHGLPLYGYPMTSYVREVGSPESYVEAENDYRTGRYQPDGRSSTYQWYVARTKRRGERFAAMALEARGLNTFLPLWRRRRHRGADDQEPLFPGYIFVRTDGRRDALLRARSAHNVAFLLGGASGPESIPEELVEEIRGRCEQRYQKPFAAGQRVIIKRGPFRELDAIFDAESSGAMRARVFVQMLHRLVPVIVDINALRAVV